MEKYLYLNIDDKLIHKDDLLIDLSEIPQGSRSKYNYQYLNEIKLQTFYKNKESLSRNLKRLEEDIEENIQSIRMVQLDKHSPKINGRKFLESKSNEEVIKNIAIVVCLKETIYQYNEIVFFCDIERKNDNHNIQCLFKIKRIEFLNQNKNTN